MKIDEKVYLIIFRDEVVAAYTNVDSAIANRDEISKDQNLIRMYEVELNPKDCTSWIKNVY